MEHIVTIKPCESSANQAVLRAVEQLVPGVENVIRFEQGEYRFDGQLVSKAYPLAICSPGEKRAIFHLNHVENLVIDGGNSDFIFQDRVFPFLLQRCKHVTLKNFHIDFDFSRYCQGAVTASDEKGFELEIDRSLFSFSADREGHVHFFGPGVNFSTQDPCAVLLANKTFGKMPWDYIFAGDTEADQSNLPTTYIETDAVETEKGLRFTYREKSRRLIFPLGEVLLMNYEPRENINILAEECEDIHIDGVDMYRGGGMGFAFANCRDVLVGHSRVMVRPGRNECRSTTADAFYFVQCRGQVKLKDCFISESMDDALNIHGIYFLADEAENGVLLAKAGIHEHEGFNPYRAGDELVISDGKTQREKMRLHVASAELREDGRVRLTLCENTDGISKGDIIQNITGCADFTLEGCTVESCPHLRISDGGKIRILNNTFRQINAILVCDLLKYWYESGAVRDMVIENNVFDQCPRAGETYPITIESSRKADAEVYHRNIRIAGNRFQNQNGRSVYASMVRGIHLKDNRLSGPDGIKLEHCYED